jgi:EpsD family peptidyl-prolyl cis-trans isomerase
MYRFAKFVMLVAVLGISLSGCGQKKPADKKEDGPVAVKVNGQPIMAADFGIMPGLNGGGPTGRPVSASDMRQMVDLELLRQAAVDSGLDKDEAIRAKLAKAPQESPRQILGLAYVNKQLSSIPAPTDADVVAYYNNNPAQFAERRQYQLGSCAIKGINGKESKIKTELEKSKKLTDFERWLKANKIEHGCVSVPLSSAQADEKLLQKLKNIPVGGKAVIEDSKDLMEVTFVQNMQNDPLTLDQAKPAIVKTLMDKKKTEGYASLIKELRAKATIEYVPPYSASGFNPFRDMDVK